MVSERPVLERRILSAIDTTPARIPVLLGVCGSGTTSLLLRLREHLGRASCQYIDLERVATTPERFLRAFIDSSPFQPGGRARQEPGSARDAFDATLEFLTTARGIGGHATFILDGALELRTFESFPGLRTVLRELMAALVQSSNRFVLATRYVARAHRLLRDASAQFEVIHLPPLTPVEVRQQLPASGFRGGPEDRDDIARSIHALADGRPAYVRALVGEMEDIGRSSPADPVSALAAQLVPGARLCSLCRFYYEMRLQRARGYGALKAILEILADEEPLTLTEIAHRLRRTPGSTKDYLSWLEDVDLVTVRQKRYSFADPVLRLWARLHCRPVPPSDDDVSKEIHGYARARLPHVEPAMALVGVGESGDRSREVDSDRKAWGIIEID